MCIQLKRFDGFKVDDISDVKFDPIGDVLTIEQHWISNVPAGDLQQITQKSNSII